MRKVQFAEDHFYHIYNRGVDKRPIFLDDRDRTRFVHSLYILNNFKEIPNRFNVLQLQPPKLLVPTEPYVEIVAACLMSNHYHLMLAPKREQGVSILLHKMGTSYTRYFNRRYERSGRLFERTFQAKLVDREAYAAYLTQYIHLNPVELYQTKFGTPRNLQQLEEYQWSTLPDYLGRPSKFSAFKPHHFRDAVLELDADAYRMLLHTTYGMLYQAKLGT